MALTEDKRSVRPARRVLEFYARPAKLTSAGKHARLFDELPSDVDQLVRAVQHLMVYDVVAADFYGFSIPEGRHGEIHIRHMEDILDRLLALEGCGLTVPRPVDTRLVGRCHHFMLFLIAALRVKGIPARGRCGFGAYFNPPFFEDHWVCEYWNADKERWILVDTQFDEVWREKLNVKHDILDVPREQFLVAADAWRKCRTGDADPSKFGIDFAGLRGLWFIAGSLVRDTAALNKMEMLPWDVWGAQPRSNQALEADELAFFDRLAAITRAPDTSFDELRESYARDDRLRVPAKVFNALLNRPEVI